MNHLARATAGVRLMLLPTLVAVLLLVLPGAAAHAGDITFSVAQDYPSSTVTYNGTASPGAIAHLYRDGTADEHADMVIANTGGGPVVQYGRGGGRFSDRRTVIPHSDTDASAVEVADFNGDGIPDIVSGGYTTLRITVMLGRRDGTFAVSGQYPLQGVWPSQFQIADLDRDGRLDIVTSSYGGGRITILLGNGDGTFRSAPPVPATTVALALVVDDFDGDAIPDMAVTESAPSVGSVAILGNQSGSLLHGSVRVLRGRGDGTFAPTGSYPVGYLSEIVRYGDINEDGEGDLIIFNVLLTNDASILYGLGGGKFAPEVRMRLSGPASPGVLDVRAGDASEGLQLADLNGDGHLDMAVTQIVSSRLVIYEGDGKGSFSPAESYLTTGFPEDLMVGDLDGRGCPDLAVPGNKPPIGPSDVGIARVSVFLNLSEGCEPKPDSAAVDPALRCTPRRVVVEDLRIEGRRVRVRGVAERDLAGKSVSIRHRGRVVARTKVRPDGTFGVTAPLPARRLRGTARYQAVVGADGSAALKLTRRITVRPLTQRLGRVTIAGRVSGPLADPRASIVLTRRVGCTYKAVKRFRPRADGTFVVKVTTLPGGAAAVYRLSTRVRHPARSRATAPTFSLPLYHRGT